MEAKYEELMASLGTTQVQSDANEYRKQAKALAEIQEQVVALPMPLHFAPIRLAVAAAA